MRPAHGCSVGLTAGLLHSNPKYRVQASATPQQGRTVGDGLQGLQSVLRRVLPALAPAAAADAARHADEVRGRRRRHNGVQRRTALVALIQTEARLSFGSAFVLERRSPGCHHGGDWRQAPCQRPGRQGIESQVCEGLVRLQSVADSAGSPESIMRRTHIRQQVKQSMKDMIRRHPASTTAHVPWQQPQRQGTRCSGRSGASCLDTAPGGQSFPAAKSTPRLCKFFRTCTPQCPSKARIICPPLPANRKSICGMREGGAI